MRSFDVAERRARLGRRHHLSPAAPGRDVASVAEHLVGLHATDPATVFLSARARVPALAVDDVEAALYRDRTLVRHLGMRRTLFALPMALVPVVQAACTDTIAAAERRRLVRDVEAGGLAADGRAWLEEVGVATLAALRAGGSATGASLSRSVPALQAKLTYAEGKSWGGEVGVATRVFTVLAAEGRIVRGRPRGSWTSGQHQWTLRAAGDGAGVDAEEARAELVRRWLAAFGPATVADLQWWTGLGVRPVALPWLRPAAWRSTSTGWPAWLWVMTSSPSRCRPRGRPFCRPSIPPPWVGRAGIGTWVPTARRCSTAAAMPAPPCGGTAGSWGGGLSGPTVRSSSAFSRTWAVTPATPSTARSSACSAGWTE